MDEEISKNYSNIIKGVAISIIFTLIFLLIFSIILTKTEISESFIEPVIIVITAISIFIGSSIISLKMKRHGMLNGALIGGIYILTIYIISGIVNNNFSLTKYSIIIIISGMACGMFGGIIGINSKKNFKNS